MSERTRVAVWAQATALVVALLLTLVGCDEECTVDDDCGRGQICDYDECVVGCRVDSDCRDGQICDTIRDACQAGCRSDDDCGAGSVCSEITNECRACQPGLYRCPCSNGQCAGVLGCCPDNTCSYSCGGGTPDPVCGDGVCEAGESCAPDCGTPTCGDGVCASGESCASDCGAPPCGDGICSPGEVCAADCQVSTSTVLPVQYVPQFTQVWCWAATSEMVLSYKGRAGTQCEMASVWLNAPCCPAGNGIQQCYQAAPSMEAIQQVIAVGGVSSQLLYRALSWDEVQAQILSGSPIIIGYLGSFNGHVVVLHGFDAAGNVYIHDPYYGSFIVPYGVSGLYAGSATWSQTLINFR